MRIYCDKVEVFSEVMSTEHRELERMLMQVRRGRHDLIIEDLDAFFASAFFRDCVATKAQVEVRELLSRQQPALADRSLDPGARPPGPRAELVPITTPERGCRRVEDAPIWEIDPASAGEWCEAPLRVMLENDDDWHLVEGAARVYGRTKVIEAKRAKFLHLDQRGGKGEIQNAVEVCQPHERVFIVMDSDRTTPGGEEDKPQRKIRELATSRPQVMPFILAKREVENYLPIAIWARAVAENRTDDRVRKLRALTKLDEAEKDFVDIEEYFGKKVAKSQSHRLMDATLVPDAATLEARAGTTELRELLDHLEAWL